MNRLLESQTITNGMQVKSPNHQVVPEEKNDEHRAASQNNEQLHPTNLGSEKPSPLDLNQLSESPYMKIEQRQGGNKRTDFEEPGRSSLVNNEPHEGIDHNHPGRPVLNGEQQYSHEPPGLPNPNHEQLAGQENQINMQSNHPPINNMGSRGQHVNQERPSHLHSDPRNTGHQHPGGPRQDNGVHPPQLLNLGHQQLGRPYQDNREHHPDPVNTGHNSGQPKQDNGEHHPDPVNTGHQQPGRPYQDNREHHRDPVNTGNQQPGRPYQDNRDHPPDPIITGSQQPGRQYQDNRERHPDPINAGHHQSGQAKQENREPHSVPVNTGNQVNRERHPDPVNLGNQVNREHHPVPVNAGHQQPGRPIQDNMEPRPDPVNTGNQVNMEHRHDPVNTGNQVNREHRRDPVNAGLQQPGQPYQDNKDLHRQETQGQPGRPYLYGAQASNVHSQRASDVNTQQRASDVNSQVHATNQYNKNPDESVKQPDIRGEEQIDRHDRLRSSDVIDRSVDVEPLLNNPIMESQQQQAADIGGRIRNTHR